jgi:hypothetical protein
MINELEWELSLKDRIDTFGEVIAPERSEHNPIGITEHYAETLAAKYKWELDIVPIPIAEGVYVRAFHFKPLDESIKRIDVEEGKEEGENDYL